MMTHDDRMKWMNDLKPGDQFVSRARTLDGFGRKYGYQIFKVVKITPKRTRFDALDPNSVHVDFDKHGTHRTGSGMWSNSFYMEPMFPEVWDLIKNDNAYLAAKNHIYKAQKLLELALADLEKRGPVYHAQIVEACKSVAKVVEPEGSSDPEDA